MYSKDVVTSFAARFTDRSKGGYMLYELIMSRSEPEWWLSNSTVLILKSFIEVAASFRDLLSTMQRNTLGLGSAWKTSAWMRVPLMASVNVNDDADQIFFIYITILLIDMKSAQKTHILVGSVGKIVNA